MKRDKPGNADYGFKDMTGYSPLFLHPRLRDNTAISPLISHTFIRLSPSKRSVQSAAR